MVEVRQESFRVPEFVALARKYGVGIVVAGDSNHPLIGDLTAPFVYARLMGSKEGEALGYSPAALDLWADRARDWAAGKTPKGMAPLAPAHAEKGGRDVYLYVISGHKVANPAAAMALIERLGGNSPRHGR